EIPGPRGGSRHREPAAVDLVRLRRVDEYVTILVIRAGPLRTDLLVPALLAAHRIGLDAERQVLVDSGVLPKHPCGVRVVAVERADSVELAHPPLAGPRPLEADERRRPAVPTLVLAETPAPEVVGARDDARPDRLGDPHLVHEPPDLRVDLEEVVGRDPEPRGVFRM